MYQQKCAIYQNSKAVRDMVLLLMMAMRAAALISSMVAAAPTTKTKRLRMIVGGSFTVHVYLG
jgi:hypothetical protein